MRDELIAHTHTIDGENNLVIEYLPKKNFRKEDRIADILKKRGNHPGLVHIFSVQESCTSYKPWHDKNTHKTFFKKFALSYHRSIMQVEYETDMVFKQQSYLQAMYDTFARTAIHTVKPENIATFPAGGRSLSKDEIKNTCTFPYFG